MTAAPIAPRGAWWARPSRQRRSNPVLPIVLVGTLAVTANLSGTIQPAAAEPAGPKPRPQDRPPIADRGKTVREAFEDARRAAKTAATAIRATLSPPATYTVQEGDTVFTIAERYDLKLAQMLALNGLSWRTAVTPGQVLKLTEAGPVAPAPPKPAAIPQDQRHTVVAGETLSSIAQSYGIALAWILSANGFATSSIIYPGQVVVIPAGAPKQAPKPAKPTITTTTTLQIPASPSDVVGLTATQQANAKLIISVGRGLGVPEYGLVIALAAAAQESQLRNLPEGDRDSLGLFQQRPSAGWGTVAQIADPSYATRLFFGGPSNPNKGNTRGLLDITGWTSMSVTQAAQAVQNSAYPNAYAKWEASARAWLKALG